MARLGILAVALATAVSAVAEVRVKVEADGRTVVYNVRAVAETSLPPARIADLRGSIAPPARQAGLDPGLVDAVIRTESGYDPRALSPKGAMGLMQLMPDTARRLGVADPYDPEQNVEGGVRYLRQLIDRFDGSLELALAAYNAGPEAVRAHDGVPPYPETRAYVARVLGLYRGDASAAAGGAAARRGRPVHVVKDGNGRWLLTTSPTY